ncbi:MAG: 2-amino-4-hydroxy-6-hydroxymethyldihydropteridine diphosphokinase [Lachnospiraceae bacterium]|nr:2-amino-4-hydroxy-6-hydroxymethyldihydropteridine diphosphokinase [Lachnospiraceae bacterium]
MDEIRISDLVVFAKHGVFEEEAVLGQKFLISAVLETDIRRPGLSDTLENTIHYGEVSHEITRFLTENRFQLIEACAEQLAEHLLFTYPLIRRLTIEIKKPWAPVGLPLDTVSVRITRGWHTAFIALGSNMGDKDSHLLFGVEELKKVKQIQVEQVSSFIKTEPYGYTEQDVFLNGACKIRTTLTPEELLDVCQHIEAEAKRVRKIHWGPRTLDLDVLFYDQEIIATERLNVPHPDMANRDFVLKPMAELAPWWGHPITHKTMQQMLNELNAR